MVTDGCRKNDDDYSQLATFDRMAHGKVRGLFLIGQNPAAGAPNAELSRAALRELDWLVVRDWFEHESANFWYADPRVTNPKSIKTEIFLSSCRRDRGEGWHLHQHRADAAMAR